MSVGMYVIAAILVVFVGVLLIYGYNDYLMAQADRKQDDELTQREIEDWKAIGLDDARIGSVNKSYLVPEGVCRDAYNLGYEEGTNHG